MNTEDLLADADFIRSLARTLVADENDAADILQETCLAALEHPPSEEKPIRAWLFRVARNAARKMRRGEASRTRRERRAAQSGAFPSTDEIVARTEDRRRLIDAVLSLDEPYRLAVLLRYFEERTPREIAAHFGIPVETVRTRLKRAIALLRSRLDEAYRNDRSAWRLAFAPLAGLKPGPAAATAPTVTVPVSTAPAATAQASTAPTAPAAASTSAACSAGGALLAGGLFMATGVKIAMTAVLVIGAGMALWQALPQPAGGSLPPTDQQTGAEVARAPALPKSHRVGDDSPAPPERVAVAPAWQTDPFAPGPADFWSLQVEVVSSTDGAPLEGALVIVGYSDIEGRPAVEQRTASNGTADFENLPISVDSVVEARCGGFVTKLSEDFDDDAGKIRIELDPGVCISGRVLLAPDLRPGVDVELDLEQLPQIWYREVLFRTDSNGCFVSEPVYPNAPFELDIDQPGYADWRQRFERADRWQPIEIVLGDGGCRVDGTVRDAAGAPVVGARVQFGWQCESEKRWPGEAITGPGGEYVFYGFPAPGDCTVGALGLDGSRGAAGPVALAASDDSVRIDVTVHAAAAQLAVRVQGAAGQPVAGARVAVLGGGTDSVWGRSGQDGVCLFRAVPPGSRVIWAVRHDEYERAAKFLVHLEAGDRRDVTVELPEGKAIAGTVVDAAGQPVRNLKVVFRVDEPPPGLPEGTPPLPALFLDDPRDLSTCRTDRAGRFRLCELPDEMGTLLVNGETNYRFDGEPAGAEEQGRVRPGGLPLRIILGDETIIRGRIPGCAAGDQVTVTARMPGGWYQGYATPCAEDGNFEMAVEFPAGEIELVLQASCTAPLVITLPCLRIAEVNDLGTIQPDPGMAVAGEVRDSSGNPMSARVSFWWPERNWHKQVRTDGAGRFRVDHLPRRELRVQFDCDEVGYAAPAMTISPAGPDWLDVVPLRYGRLEGQVADGRGRPLAGAAVGLRRSPGEKPPWLKSADTAGRFDFDRILPGRYRILVKPAGREEWIDAGEASVREDETTRVELAVHP